MKNTSPVPFVPVRLSLADLVGEEYVALAARGRGVLTGGPAAALRRLGQRKIDFFPAAFQRRLTSLLGQVGRRVSIAAAGAPAGATTARFRQASNLDQSPVGGLGYYRLGQDGRLRFLLKSEHYHAPLGHSFPGYELLDIARALGVPNATHNNTRGWIARLLEEELVRTANGLADDADVAPIIARQGAGRLNRVLNLETGSLACEAAIKMMLARFYRVQSDSPAPTQARTPVFLVMADDEGGPAANYHGTTIIAQMLRGMWPGLYQGMDRAGLLKVVPIRPNDIESLEHAFTRYDRGRCKIAGLLHELVLMNYGGRRLDERFVRRMYQLCRRHDVPTLCDEIQTCLWSPRLYMFREYGVTPTFVAVGKGFPGGEYPASRLIFQAHMDSLPQFGALVTNGQEELASLAYLVTMRWAQANAAVTERLGEEYEHRLRDLADRHPRLLTGVEGRRHLAALCFQELDKAKAFARRVNEAELDISVQTYKASTPPAALTKLPLIAGPAAIDMVIDRLGQALAGLD